MILDDESPRGGELRSWAVYIAGTVATSILTEAIRFAFDELKESRKRRREKRVET